MNRRNLLTSLIGVFGLASTAKAEEPSLELAQLTAERNGYKAAWLRAKNRKNEPIRTTAHTKL